jgi:hypothetical protein
MRGAAGFAVDIRIVIPVFQHDSVLEKDFIIRAGQKRIDYQVRVKNGPAGLSIDTLQRSIIDAFLVPHCAKVPVRL